MRHRLDRPTSDYKVVAVFLRGYCIKLLEVRANSMKLKLVNGPGKCCICLRQETSNICGNFVNLRTDYFFVD